jgi:hypothetical protein
VQNALRVSADIAGLHDDLLAVHGALEFAAHQIDDRLVVVGMQWGPHTGSIENLQHDHLLALQAQLHQKLTAKDLLPLERADPDRFAVKPRRSGHACLHRSSMLCFIRMTVTA